MDQSPRSASRAPRTRDIRNLLVAFLVSISPLPRFLFAPLNDGHLELVARRLLGVLALAGILYVAGRVAIAVAKQPVLVGLLCGLGAAWLCGQRCADGWASPSIGLQGACSWHGGVSSAPIWWGLFAGVAGFAASAFMITRRAGRAPLVVTLVLGIFTAGCAPGQSALVLDLLAARAQARPSFVNPALGGLHAPRAGFATLPASGWRCSSVSEARSSGRA
jgi:hypothetical protein